MDLFGGLRPDTVYFASGSNHVGEVLGFNDIGHAVGVSADRVGDDVVRAVASLTVPLFCDSGAFGEVSMTNGRPTITRPIMDAEWRDRLAMMRRLVEACPTEVTVVAPDCVGHQDVTLQRLRTYRREVLQLVEAGARVLVCVQLGPMALVEFWREAAGIFPGGCVVPAIPMKKNAVSVAELAAFARAVRPSDCHLLGLGESNARWIQATEALGFAGCARVTCDSVKILAHVGRSNGPDGGPRRLTAAQDQADEEIDDAIFAGDVDLPDYTDEIMDPDGWMPAGEQAAFRAAWDINGSISDWLEQDAPNGEFRGLDPLVLLDLDEVWVRWHRNNRGAPKKRRAIRLAFGASEGPPRARGAAGQRGSGRTSSGRAGGEQAPARRAGAVSAAGLPADAARGGVSPYRAGGSAAQSFGQSHSIGQR